MKVTPCECKEAGWCERHQCEKSRHFYELCRRRQDYFEQFENGQSILQQVKRSFQQRAACQFRGETVNEIECPICRRTVMLKVFDCAQHERCTIAKAIDDMACCASCEDFLALDSS